MPSHRSISFPARALQLQGAMITAGVRGTTSPAAARRRLPARRALLPVLVRLCLLAWLAVLATPLRGLAADEFLPAEQAYRHAARIQGEELILTWTIAPGYYLYKNRMAIASSTAGVRLGEPRWPQGESHTDEFFGTQEIYRGSIEVPVAISLATPPPKSLQLQLRLQGCADAGLCYPPLQWHSTIALPRLAGSGRTEAAAPRSWFNRRAAGGSEFLPADEAFRFAAEPAGADTIALTWIIAEGYYLYKDQIQLASRSAGVELGMLQLPPGQATHDEFYGDTEVYYGVLEASLPVARATHFDGSLLLQLRYQGCAAGGLCYNPITRDIELALPAGGGDAAAPAAATAGVAALAGAAPGDVPATGVSERRQPAAAVASLLPEAAVAPAEQDRLAGLIRQGRLPLVLATFFGLGVLLSLTPCVLPMIPILSGIIVGQGGRVSPARGFVLALVYVQGMALTYAAAGAAFVLAFNQAPQAFFQQPWIIIAFALLFVILALAMFGIYDLQLPAAVQTRLAHLSNRQRRGSWLGTFIMGALSALIVTACVAPAIIAALSVIGQSGQVLRGAGALYATGLGMGLPLLLIGASAGSLLPRAGPWMDSIKALFGVLFLAVALHLLQPLLPDALVLALWALLAITTGYWLRGLQSRTGTSNAAVGGLGLAMLAYGMVLLVGAALGGADPLRPLAPLAGRASGLPASEAAQFHKIKTFEDLQQAIARAGAAGQGVMLDFYADWCISCKEMEKYTFSDPAVRAALARVVLLRADVTANDRHDQDLMRQLGIFGPPTIVFFGTDGRERASFRLAGFVPAQRFERHVRAAFAN